MKPDAAETALSELISRYEVAIQERARSARSVLRELIPGAVELVYDNYSAC